MGQEQVLAGLLVVLLLVLVSCVLWYTFGDGFVDVLKAVGIILLCSATMFTLIYLVSVVATGSWTAFFTTDIT